MISTEKHLQRITSDSDDKQTREHRNGLGSICTCGRMSASDMMMTVAIDSEKLETVSDETGCAETDKVPCNGNNSKKKANPVWLESSFVHLMAPRNNIRTKTDHAENPSHRSSATPSQISYHQIHQDQHHYQHSFLERHKHLLQLLEAAYAHVDDIEQSDNHDTEKTDKDNNGRCRMVELCGDCIDRVASALEADTQRLYAEVEMYRETVQTSKQRLKALERTTKHVTSAEISSTSTLRQGASHDHNNNDTFINKTIEEAYQEEIAMLEKEIQARCDELLHYKYIHEEQTNITDELSKLEDCLQSEENSLELQSEAFDNRRHVLTKALAEVQNEVDKLTCISLPQVLFDLQVDQARGLHYPLINQLRLAFRPKGDVPAQEIQVAWSQATQLLLILGTLLEYPGLDWKLVPLADCAKLIYRKEIFNLVPGDCRSLMAWNALLDQVVKHALSLVVGDNENVTNRMNSASVSGNKHMKEKGNNNSPGRNNDHLTLFRPSLPPYSSSPTTIGNTELARLDPIDHVGWSQVIHRMASNLLWLSNRASALSATQVSSLAHCVV